MLEDFKERVNYTKEEAKKTGKRMQDGLDRAFEAGGRFADEVEKQAEPLLDEADRVSGEMDSFMGMGEPAPAPDLEPVGDAGLEESDPWDDGFGPEPEQDAAFGASLMDKPGAESGVDPLVGPVEPEPVWEEVELMPVDDPAEPMVERRAVVLEDESDGR